MKTKYAKVSVYSTNVLYREVYVTNGEIALSDPQSYLFEGELLRRASAAEKRLETITGNKCIVETMEKLRSTYQMEMTQFLAMAENVEENVLVNDIDVTEE